MESHLQAAVTLTASVTLIAAAVMTVGPMRMLGQLRGLGDIPVGAILGFTSVAQMFHPISPLEGFIFDLRMVPLVLAGAFLSPGAALLALALALKTRYAVGGGGMVPGLVGMILATSSAMLWQHLRRRLPLLKERPWLSHFFLGAGTCTSMLAGLLMPPDMVRWFITNAVPVLATVYLFAVPALAWFMDKKLDMEPRQSGALEGSELQVLGLRRFTRTMRVRGLFQNADRVHGILKVDLSEFKAMYRHSAKVDVEEMVDAVLLHLSRVFPDVRTVGNINDQILLLPLTEQQVKKVEALREKIFDMLGKRPLHLSDGERLWVPFKLSLIASRDLERRGLGAQAKPLIPSDQKGADGDASSASAIADAKETTLPPFGIPGNADLLFAKANLLMK